MAKLSKIRLTNCKYDGLRKKHENSIFDLTKDGDPSHGLFTLANGGGKGVMMQFIFQIMLPETRWGGKTMEIRLSPHFMTIGGVIPIILLPI